MHSIRPWVFGFIVCAMLAAGVSVLHVRRNAATQKSGSQRADLLKADSSPASAEIMSVGNASFGHGRWYLTDTRTHRLHVLDSAGKLLRSFGRRGRGPGEFVVPHQVAAGAARIFVSELAQPDISVFDSTGRFLRYLRNPHSCSGGHIAAMSAPDSSLYVLRRCIELPRRIRYQVERSQADKPLELWPAIADTLHIRAGGLMPLEMPLFAVFGGRLILGDGHSGCIRIFRLSDGFPAGKRCFHEVSRQAMPSAQLERLNQRARGRVAVPDSLPRVIDLMLLDSVILVQAAETFDTTRWLELSWVSHVPPRVRELGRAQTEQSFVNGRARLIVWEEPNGIRIEVVPIER